MWAKRAHSRDTSDSGDMKSETNATRDEKPRALKLAIKQYVPVQSPEPDEETITLIAAHANGFPKACFIRCSFCTAPDLHV